MGKEKGKQENSTPSTLILLEFSPIKNAGDLNRDFVANRLSATNYSDFSIIDNKSILVRFEDIEEAKGLYKLCKKKLLQLSETNSIVPTYIPTRKCIYTDDLSLNTSCSGISILSESISDQIPSLFMLLQSLTFSEKQDVIFTPQIPHLSIVNSWKQGYQRYTWKSMPESIQSWMQMHTPAYDSLLIKKVSPLMSIPLHLDHMHFAPTFIACLVTPVSSLLHVYNYTEHHFFTRPIEVSPPIRYQEFLSVEVLSDRPCYLLLFTSLCEINCTCGSAYCMQTILHSEKENVDAQSNYVDKAYPLLSSYFASSTTKFFKPVLSFISSFKPYSRFYPFESCVGLLLDTGCGDCKYIYHYQKNPTNTYCLFGQDNCRDMLLIDKYTSHTDYRLIQSDIGHLSMRPGCLDGVLAISVLQHLPNRYKQLEALEALIRVCRKKGRVLVYVWSYENKWMKPRLADGAKEYLLPWKVEVDVLKKMKISFDALQKESFIGQLDYTGFDVVENAVEVKRYYFLFMNGELEFLLSYFPSIQIKARFFDGQNWCVELEVILVVC